MVEQQKQCASHERYSLVAVLLHWIIAGLIIADLWIGIDFADPRPGERFSPKPLLPLHISLGVTILLLSVARLAWRIWRRPPPHRESMNRVEAFAAHATHAVLYGLMIGIPLSGWLIISAHKVFPFKTLVWGLLEWPMLPFFGDMSAAQVEQWHARFAAAHLIMAQYLLTGLLILHILAVAKHHLVDRDPVLKRMLPRGPRRNADGKVDTPGFSWPIP